MAAVKGVWLELHPTPEWSKKFHALRKEALPNTTQREEDPHFTILYLGKEISDKQIEELWKEGAVPFIKEAKDYPFIGESVKMGTWGPPVIMLKLTTENPWPFENLYQSFYLKALELGIKVAGTNATPGHHNGYHVTIDKRDDPSYTEDEIRLVKRWMGAVIEHPIPFDSIRLVRGDLVLKSHSFH